MSADYPPSDSKPGSESSPPPNKAVQVLRIVLYATPAPACLAVVATVAARLPAAYRFGVSVGLCLFILIGFGVFDALLASTVPKEGSKPKPRPLFVHTGTFVITQIVCAPVIFLTIIVFAFVFQLIHGELSSLFAR